MMSFRRAQRARMVRRVVIRRLRVVLRLWSLHHQFWTVRAWTFSVQSLMPTQRLWMSFLYTSAFYTGEFRMGSN
ncbi:hypothetical protein BDR22DRAFT_864178 [Usnea florida]